MIKKAMFLFTLVLLVFTAACSSSGGEGSDAGASNDSDSKTLTLWHIETAGQEETLLNAVERFEEKNEGVNVEVVQQENDPYKTKLSVAMGGGSPPDVFHSWGGGWLENFVNAGQVADLTEEVDPDNYLQAGLSPSVFDEKIYGAPLGMSVVPVWYNKEIFAEYGLEEPETYDDLLNIVETLTANDIIPFALANKPKWPGSFYMMYLAERIGGPELFNEAFNREGRGFDDEAYVEAGHKIQELVEMGAFPDGMNGLNYDTGQSRTLLYSGKAAMLTQVDSVLDNTRNDAPEFEEKLGFFLFPEVEGGKGAQNHIVGGVSPVFSVSENSENKELAIELVKELTSQETATDFANIGGGISAVQGVEYEDEFVQSIVTEVLESSEFMQTFYDQTLPPELATAHLDTTQALFGLSMTPEEAVAQVEEKAKEELE